LGLTHAHQPQVLTSFTSNFVAYTFAMSDQCALDKSGSLKEAKDIEFFFSESEMTPLPSSAALPQCNPGNTGKSYVPLHAQLTIVMPQGFDVANRRRT
jgi:hypothetical protein